MKRLYHSTMFSIAALMLFSTVALFALVYISTQGIDRMAREEEREMRVAMSLIEDGYRLKVAFAQQMVGLRGYLAAGDPALLRTWEQGKQDFAEAVAELDASLQQPEDRRLLEAVLAIETRHRAVGDALIALKREGREAEARTLFLEDSRPLNPEALQAIDALIEAQRRQVWRLHEQVQQAEQQVRTQLTLGALLSVPESLFLAAMLLLRVLLPLRELAAASRALTEGHYEVRVKHQRPDEFGEVAAAFNTMAGAVERSLTSLRESNEELKRVDRYKDDFLSVVTHELKTPLTAIVGFARMMERNRSGPPLTEPQRHSLGKILSNASRMLALVNDMLDSTTIRQGRLELQPAPTPYAPLVAEVVAQVQALAQQKHQTQTLGP
ncbi:MAG: histidine kinase dimerization/phospho-acceptor domain-containing protein, partial [Candidatus Sericytochromatia bacterium]